MSHRKSSRSAPRLTRRRGALGSVLVVTLCVLALLAVPGSAAAGARTAPQSGGSALVALEQATLTAGDAAAGDTLGYSVALDGNTALVGAYNATADATGSAGAAYVFTRTGSTWTQQAKLTAGDAATGDQFGLSVALVGDTAVIGADGKTVDGDTSAGAVYVFTRTGTTWTQQQKLTASDEAIGDQFGWSVAVAGDTAVIGADYKSVAGNTDAGAAYVFTRTGTTWTQQQRLTAADGAAEDLFGNSVAVAGDTAVVGAEFKTVSTDLGAGAAYVFTRSGTTWTQQQKLTAADAASSDNFGSAVALSGDTALVGAAHKFVSGSSVAGAAYVYTRTGTTWTSQATLHADDVGQNDQFGHSVSLSGNTALIGAPGKTVSGAGGVGAAYVFGRSGTHWTQQTRMTASDGATLDNFGWSVSLSGTTALAGAWQKTVGANLNAGAAYVDMLNPAPSLSLKAAPRSVKVGSSVALSGAVSHAIAGVKTVNICRKVGSKLTRLKQLKITKSGAFKWSLTPKKAGKWVLVATYKFGRTTFMSKTVTVTVKK